MVDFRTESSTSDTIADGLKCDGPFSSRRAAETQVQQIFRCIPVPIDNDHGVGAAELLKVVFIRTHLEGTKRYQSGHCSHFSILLQLLHLQRNVHRLKTNSRHLVEYLEKTFINTIATDGNDEKYLGRIKLRDEGGVGVVGANPLSQPHTRCWHPPTPCLPP